MDITAEEVQRLARELARLELGVEDADKCRRGLRGVAEAAERLSGVPLPFDGRTGFIEPGQAEVWIEEFDEQR